MSFEIVQFNLFGVRPLMQNKVDLDGLEKPADGKRQVKAAAKTPLQEATDKMHVTDDGDYYHPGQAFWRAIVDACPNITIGGKAATGFVPRAVEPAEEEVILVDPKTLNAKTPKRLGKKSWVIDRRAIQTTKGMILVRRPMFKTWGARLALEVDREVIPVKANNALLMILNNAGRMGVGSGRLHKETKGSSSGWFGIRMGKFRAELWK